MSKLRINLASNFFASLITVILSLVFVPVYLRMIGVEGYGLVGFFGVMQTVMAMLDLGLSTTLNRELAVLSVGVGQKSEMRILVSTIGVIYWSIGMFVCAGLLAASSWIAGSWLHTGSIDQGIVLDCVRIGVAGLFFAWPASLYSGGLMGLQWHARMNVILVVCNLLRYGGVVPLLYFSGNDVRVFFLWQLFVNLLQTFLYMGLLRLALGGNGGGRVFDVTVLRNRWNFAAGVGFVTVLGIILTQTDKIILSRILTLEMFGYYALASSIALALYRLINPVLSAVFPRFSELLAKNDFNALSNLYHSCAQFLAVLLFPVLAVVLFFSWDIICVWTRNSVIADHTTVVLKLLIAGSVLNGIASLPIMLQWAAKWTSLHITVTLVMVVVLVPLLIVFSLRYGAIGGASVWLLLNAIFVAVMPVLTHRRLIPAALLSFYIRDILPPLAASLVAAAAVRIILGGFFKPGLVSLVLTYGAVLAICIGAAVDIRRRLFRKMREVVGA